MKHRMEVVERGLRATLTNTNLMLVLSCGWTLSMAAISLVVGDWTWFQRSGAICSTLGVLLAIRCVLRKGVRQAVEDSRIIDGGGAAPTPEDLEAQRQLHLDGKALLIGSILSILGALISSFGDLIGEIWC
jgi:hypothetical protein